MKINGNRIQVKMFTHRAPKVKKKIVRRRLAYRIGAECRRKAAQLGEATAELEDDLRNAPPSWSIAVATSPANRSGSSYQPSLPDLRVDVQDAGPTKEGHAKRGGKPYRSP